ncbi:MAG TPA: hypothetical protein VJU87_02150 [Gemmatimonadaceae bacterium]|nr:hypothetical protein [Gemmatimonadaceae bacterium]
MTLALPAGGRAPLLRLMDASAETCAACAAPLRQLIELVDLQLDSASIAELERLANALAAASCAEPRPPASAIAE